MHTTAPPIIRFESAVPQFTVPDVVRTAEYYRDVLGFEIAGYWDGERVSLLPDTSPVAIVWRDQIQVFFSRADQPDGRTGRAEGAPDAYGQRELVVGDCNGLVLAFGEDISQRAAGRLMTG